MQKVHSGGRTSQGKKTKRIDKRDEKLGTENSSMCRMNSDISKKDKKLQNGQTRWNDRMDSDNRKKNEKLQNGRTR